MSVQTTNLLEIKQSKSRVVWMLAWPAIIEQILLSLVNYIDTAMVGALGPDATASVGINSTVGWLIMSIMSIFATGFSILVAQNIGANQMEKAKETVRQALLTVAMMATLIFIVAVALAGKIPLWMGLDPRLVPTAASYLRILLIGIPFHFFSFVCSSILRSAGDTKSPMVFNALSNVINVCLNYLFIYPSRQISVFGANINMWGAGWGVPGAAVGSTISMIFTGVSLTLLLFYKKYPLKLSFKDKFKLKSQEVKSALKIGVPAGVERIIITLGQITSTRIVATLGTTSIAAHTLANTAESMCYMPAAGFQHAATTLVAQSHGARRDDDAYGFGMRATMIGIYAMIAFGAALFVFAPFIMSIFTPDGEVVRLGSNVLRIVAFAQPMSATGGTLSGALRGVGEIKYPFAVGLIGMWAIRIPLAVVAIFGFKQGFEAIWVAMTIDLIVRGILFLHRFMKKGWWRAQEGPTTEQEMQS